MCVMLHCILIMPYIYQCQCMNISWMCFVYCDFFLLFFSAGIVCLKFVVVYIYIILIVFHCQLVFIFSCLQHIFLIFTNRTKNKSICSFYPSCFLGLCRLGHGGDDLWFSLLFGGYFAFLAVFFLWWQWVSVLILVIFSHFFFSSFSSYFILCSLWFYCVSS